MTTKYQLSPGAILSINFLLSLPDLRILIAVNFKHDISMNDARWSGLTTAFLVVAVLALYS